MKYVLELYSRTGGDTTSKKHLCISRFCAEAAAGLILKYLACMLVLERETSPATSTARSSFDLRIVTFQGSVQSASNSKGRVPPEGLSVEDGSTLYTAGEGVVQCAPGRVRNGSCRLVGFPLAFSTLQPLQALWLASSSLMLSTLSFSSPTSPFSIDHNNSNVKLRAYQ